MMEDALSTIIVNGYGRENKEEYDIGSTGVGTDDYTAKKHILIDLWDDEDDTATDDGL